MLARGATVKVRLLLVVVLALVLASVVVLRGGRQLLGPGTLGRVFFSYTPLRQRGGAIARREGRVSYERGGARPSL